MVTEAQIRQLALALPGAYEQPSCGGRPSFRTKARMFAWLRDDPEALVVWVPSMDAKQALLVGEPHRFFTTPHDDGHPIVLARLEAVSPDRSPTLLTASYRQRAPAALVRQLERRRS